MNEDRSLLLKASMTYGLSMGLFWLIKYLFFILGFSFEFMNVIYWGFTFSVPYLAYRMTLLYRQSIGGRIGFLHAWQFGVLVYLFGALIVSLEHFIFYRYIAPPDLIANTMKQTIELFRQSNADPELIERISGVRITPIMMAIQGIFSNILYGVVFSLPVALLAANRRRGDSQPPVSSIDNTK